MIPQLIKKKKRKIVDTVSTNKKLAIDTVKKDDMVSTNKSYAIDTLFTNSAFGTKSNFVF